MEEDENEEQSLLCIPKLVGATSCFEEVSSTKGGRLDFKSQINRYGNPLSREFSGAEKVDLGGRCDLCIGFRCGLLIGLGAGIGLGFMTGFSAAYGQKPDMPVPSAPVPALPYSGSQPSTPGDTGPVESKPKMSVVPSVVNTTRGNPYFFYASRDTSWFSHWSQRHQFSSKAFPKVLLFTQCTEDVFFKFASENYWKSCYAHAHGFDVVFATDMSVTGGKKYSKQGSDARGKWYAEEKLWGWVPSVQPYLFSGQYDYVFITGADVKINYVNLDFPLWAYDKGHDITIMDQDPVSYGLNDNGMLFKPSAFSKQFLNELYAYRTEFWLQADNGAYMEILLTLLGREAEQLNRSGYDQKCLPICKLDKPSVWYIQNAQQWLLQRSALHSKCFFKELNRLVGSFGHRESKVVGFSSSFVYNKEFERLYYADTSAKSNNQYILTPWANCFDWVRKTWKDPESNCFAFHWNGLEKLNRPTNLIKEQRGCPDPSFDWDASPWNPANRGI